MRSFTHKTTMPLIINVDDDGPRLLTPHTSARADDECLLVIYPHPTLRQARIQLWMSIKMLTTALRRATALYFRRINRGHDATYRQYPATRSETNHRSSTHGNA